MDDFNRFAGLRFPRTQPIEWRNIPFEGDTKLWPVVAKTVGVIILWLALFGLSMWSISQQEISAHAQTTRAAR